MPGTQKHYLALDLGAESGRAVLASYDGTRLMLEELHRFPNTPVRLPDGLHWDVLRLFAECQAGLARAVQRTDGELVSLGLDTWGVDYGLLDKQGALLGQPFHYRDSRTDDILPRAFRRLKRERIFEQTGLQFMPINTLFQLFAEERSGSPQLEIAARLLMIPDLLNYWFTGVAANERTIASTSQCLNPRKGDWARSVINHLGLPARIFGEIIQPGTVLARVRPDIAAETGGKNVNVVAPGCHDTASAVAAVPAEEEHFAYLSSGTWSLMGVEVATPVINEKSLAYNFTNEGGVCGTIRLLKNITGLWLVQECRRAWAAEGKEYSYADLATLAEKAPPFAAVLDPDYPEFAKPGGMPERIQVYCRKTKQKVPEDHGVIVRTVLEGLALKYRRTLEMLEELQGHPLPVLHIVGGGTQNRLLNQLAADATGRLVITGPVEATAAGNVLLQMLAAKDIHSLAEGRALIRRSFSTERYEPRSSGKWDEAYAKFQALPRDA